MILFKTDYLEISYAVSDNLILTRWLGSVTKEEYRKGLVACLNIISNYEVKYWLEDCQLVNDIDQKDKAWKEEIWLPEFVSIAGNKLERMAKIIPRESLKKGMPIQQSGNQKIRYFSFLNQEFEDFDQAIKWLLVKPCPQSETLKLAM